MNAVEFPIDAVKLLVELFKRGLSGNNLGSVLLKNWQDVVTSAIALVTWFLQSGGNVEPIGSGPPENAEVDAVSLELARLCCEERGVALGPIGSVSWLTIVLWVVELVGSAET